MENSDKKASVLFVILHHVMSVAPEELKSSTKDRNISDARRIFSYVMHLYSGLSDDEVGDYINKDGSSVARHLKNHEKDKGNSRAYDSNFHDIKGMFCNFMEYGEGYLQAMVEILKLNIGKANKELQFNQLLLEAMKNPKT